MAALDQLQDQGDVAEQLLARGQRQLTFAMRARRLGISIGHGTPAVFNAITDVPGVRVGHSTLWEERNGKPLRTGVSLVQPRAGSTREQPCFAGCHVLNGNGDATSLEWIRETCHDS